MSEDLLHFLKDYPFWAIIIIVLMVLPVIGAILHVVLKALGRKGIDGTGPITDTQPDAPSDTESHRSTDENPPAE